MMKNFLTLMGVGIKVKNGKTSLEALVGGC
jgi:hypothetical protein